MDMLLRNFFYAVCVTGLIVLHGLDAETAQFADLVRATQSPLALQLALVLTGFLVGLELLAVSQLNGRARWAALTGGSDTKGVQSSTGVLNRAGSPSVPLGGSVPPSARQDS